MHTQLRYTCPLALATLLIAGPPALHGQSATRIILSGGFAAASAVGGERWESGPELGIGVQHALSTRIGLEGRVATAILPMAVAVADCLPGATCYSHISSPGAITSATAHLVVRPVSRLAILAGAGYAWAGDPGIGPTEEPISSISLTGVLRFSPFTTSGRGPALEVRGHRFTRNIGSLTWLLAPGFSWAF